MHFVLLRGRLRTPHEAKNNVQVVLPSVFNATTTTRTTTRCRSYQKKKKMSPKHSDDRNTTASVHHCCPSQLARPQASKHPSIYDNDPFFKTIIIFQPKNAKMVLTPYESILQRTFSTIRSHVLGSQLLQPGSALKQATVNGRGNGQGAADNRAQPRQEAKERLGSLLAVDDLHGGNVLNTVSALFLFRTACHR